MTTGNKIYRVIKPLLFGCIVGIISGGVIALFLTSAKVVCAFAFSLYAQADGALTAACVVFLVLTACLLTAVLQTLCPSGKGSGIPLAEGCARGMLRVKWLRAAAALIAGSLLSFVCGMPLGSEGPSIGVGGLIGDGVGKTTKQSDELRRYLITGGASAGLAVAFNAPLTGVTLALEETHRRFSPGILLAAFSAVVPAVLVAQLIFWGLGHNAYLNALGIREGFTVLPHLIQTRYDGAGIFFSICGIAVLCGVACAALATAFNRSIFALGKLSGKISSPALRLLPAFALTAVCGLTFATSVGSGESSLASVSVASATGILFALLAVRFFITVTASGSGATGGLFLPMIAIGGVCGTLAAKACVACGMPEAYAGNIVLICIAAFFAASVRAPISAIVMTLELTASFANVLPCAIAVAVATAICALTRSAPLYERMMEDLHARAPKPSDATDVTATGIVTADSTLCGKRIRDVLWPYNSLVTELVRADGTRIVPDGETFILVSDKLTLNAESVSPDELRIRLDEFDLDRTVIDRHDPTRRNQ